MCARIWILYQSRGIVAKINLWDEYWLPSTLDEALKLLTQYGTHARIVAGGTDLVLAIEEGRISGVAALVDISRLQELKTIQEDHDSITIGAGITLSELMESKVVHANSPILAEAAGLIAGRQIRNIATVGGNVINASPAADLIPAFLVLESTVLIARSDGAKREAPLADFLQGVRKVDLRVGELVVEFRFKRPASDTLMRFHKVQLRRAMAISLINLAIYLRVDAGLLSDVRIAMGAVAPTTLRLQALEQALTGMRVTEVEKFSFREFLQAEIAPISDFRGSSDYRFNVAERLLEAEIQGLLTGAN